MVVDKVSDLIISIKNAGMVNKDNVEIQYSKFKHQIAKKLHSCGFLDSVEHKSKPKSRLVIKLRYNKNGQHCIHDVKRISRPSHRVYGGAKKIVPIKTGRGVTLLSTPKGILTDREARRENVGGELLFSIW